MISLERERERETETETERERESVPEEGYPCVLCENTNSNVARISSRIYFI